MGAGSSLERLSLEWVEGRGWDVEKRDEKEDGEKRGEVRWEGES